MGDAIGKIIEELLEIIKRNYRHPKLWFAIIAIIFFVVLLIPYIDSNFFYFSRIDKRIEILQKIINLDQDMINSNQTYLNEYQSILQEMEKQNNRSINSVMNGFVHQISYLSSLGMKEGNKLLKFVTGAIWLLLITVMIPFMNTFKKRSEKILAFFLLLVISVVVGGIFTIVPIVISPWINYIGFPIGQIIIVIIIALKINKKKKAK